MSDYDNRQYGLMLEQLNQFESKRIDLKHLITGLESLLGVLEKVDPKWKSAFQSKWGVLEEVYADMLDRGHKELPGLHQDLVAKAVRDLKAMVETALPDNTKG
jgi:hypothetical protein